MRGTEISFPDEHTAQTTGLWVWLIKEHYAYYGFLPNVLVFDDLRMGLKKIPYGCPQLEVNAVKSVVGTRFQLLPPSPVFLIRVLWRHGSKKSWWHRGCWTLTRDLDQGGTLRMRSWQSCRRDKPSSKPWPHTTEPASRSCFGEDTGHDLKIRLSLFRHHWHDLFTCCRLTGWRKRRCANRSSGRESGYPTMRSWRVFDESWQPGRRNVLQPRRRRTRHGRHWRKGRASSSYWMDRWIKRLCLWFKRKVDSAVMWCVMVCDSVCCQVCMLSVMYSWKLIWSVTSGVFFSSFSSFVS